MLPFTARSMRESSSGSWNVVHHSTTGTGRAVTWLGAAGCVAGAAFNSPNAGLTWISGGL